MESSPSARWPTALVMVSLGTFAIGFLGAIILRWLTSPTAVDRSKCIRISNLPLTWGSEDLVNALRLVDDSLHNWEVPLRQIFIFPSVTGRSQTAVLNLRDCPKFFKSDRIAKGLYVTTHDEVDLEIDSHFNGLTPLNVPGDTELDVIAVTGLAGHAFESWRDRDSGKMWLFDFLPKAFNNIRVFTFGYNSSLVENVNNDFATMIEYRKSFLSAVENTRKTEAEKNRPLVLIGHNMGGIVILGSLLQAKGDLKYKHIHDATAGVFFFGTPHQGMHVGDFLEILEDQSAKTSTRNELVTQLKEGSSFLRNQYTDLLSLWPPESRPLIVSFYETLTTPRLVKSAKGWIATGEGVLRVSPSSSALFWAGERREPVEADNNNMVKFATESNQTYGTVIGLLGEVLKEQKSRPRTPKMEGCLTSLSENLTRADIRRYLHEAPRASANRYGDAADVVSIAEESNTSRADAIFLWVHLVKENLRETGNSVQDIRAALETLPEDLVALHARILGRTNEHKRPEMKRLLIWAVMVQRPLSVQEIQYILAVSNTTEKSTSMTPQLRGKESCPSVSDILREMRELDVDLGDDLGFDEVLVTNWRTEVAG